MLTLEDVEFLQEALIFYSIHKANTLLVEETIEEFAKYPDMEERSKQALFEQKYKEKQESNKVLRERIVLLEAKLITLKDKIKVKGIMDENSL